MSEPPAAVPEPEPASAAESIEEAPPAEVNGHQEITNADGGGAEAAAPPSTAAPPEDTAKQTEEEAEQEAEAAVVEDEGAEVVGEESASPKDSTEEPSTPAPEPASPSLQPQQHHHGGHSSHAAAVAAAAARAAKMESAHRLQEFEAQRCAYFGAQIRSNATHWHAFAATLQRAQAENERVLDFFSKRLAIEQLYCDKLRELPFEELKGGGGGWRSSTTAAGGKGKAHSPTHRHKGPTPSSDPKQQQQQPPSPQELAALREHYRAKGVALPAMEELVLSLDHLVDKYGEYVADTRKELIEGRLKPLAGVYKATSGQILAEGSQALENVQRAEQHVQGAYAELARAISTLSPSPMLPSSSSAAKEEGHGDLWLADMQYRVAVELQKRVWATAQAQLGALFGRMKALELSRRQQLHALTLRFMQNQGGFWGQLPSLAAESALRISSFAPSDAQEVETALADEIRSGARAAKEKEQEKQLQQQQQAAKHGGKKAAAISPPRQQPPPQQAAPATPSAEPFTGALRSPLDTPLVKKTAVLQHKVVTGMESLPLLKRWRPTLAVLTVDNTLHLFDLPASTATTALTSLTPKEAFRTLVPQPLDNKGRVRKGKEAERVKPTVSLSLGRSRARFRPEEGDGAFDVTKSTANVGLVKVFKSYETRKVTLRAKTQAEMVDWCVIVNGEEEHALP